MGCEGRNYPALLAQKGLTGPESIFEGRFGVKAFTSKFDASKISNELGERFDIINSSMKKYPSCLYNAAAIDGILKLEHSEGLRAGDVDKIEVGVRNVAYDIVAEPAPRKYDPQTVLDAQMSMPYSVAVGLIDGKASLDQFSEERINDPLVRELAQRVSVYIDPEMDGRPMTDASVVIKVRTRGGKELVEKVDYYRGDPRNPLSTEELKEKFLSNVSRVYTGDHAENIFQEIMALEKLRSANDLTDLLH